MPTQVKLMSCAIAAALLGFSMPGVAETSDQEVSKDDSSTLQEVVLTGSLLKRYTGSVAQPMVILQADDLLKAGATNPEQILKTIPQNQAFNVSNVTIGIGTGAGAYANLRSLGSARTLVLLDGKRIVNNPYQTVGVDLNTVPMALLERVEVLADGGSSTYGTDAIAGVVNFITAKELTGFNAAATATTPEAAGGGQTYLANMSGGFGSLEAKGWNVYAGASYRKATELPNTARRFSATGYMPSRGIDFTQDRTYPANYYQPDTGLNDFVNPAAPGCGPAPLLYANGDFGSDACGYDTATQGDISIPQEQLSFLAKGTLKVGENHTASLEFVRGDNKLLAVVSPISATDFEVTPSNPAVAANNGINPYFPGNGLTPAHPSAAFDPNASIFIRWRAAELGRRLAQVQGYADRAVAQLEGRLGAWDYQASAMLSTSVVRINLQQGFVNNDILRAGFTGDAGLFLNPFGPQNAAGLAYLQDAAQVNGEAQRSIGDLKVYGVQFNRDLFRLPGGRVTLAVAADYKEESARFENNFDITDQLPNVFRDVQDARGRRNSKGLSFEVNLPVLEKLEVGLATRYDGYSDFGNTTNPEVSMRYNAAGWLTLRGSYNTAFRAPTLFDIFQPTFNASTDNAYDDPILCPNGADNPLGPGGVVGRDCGQFSQISSIQGGNPRLKPEKSDAYTLGFILKPWERTSFGVDYFNYHLKDTIGRLGDLAIFGNLDKFGSHVVRCSAVPQSQWSNYFGCAFPGSDNTNAIAFVQDTLDNLGDTKTSGFDATAYWSGPQTVAGTFRIQYLGTYVSRYEFQREPGGVFVSRVGRYVDNSAVLKYVHSLTLAWDRGPLTLELTHRYKSSYEDCNGPCLTDPQPQFFNRVGAFQIFDLSATYRWHDKLTVIGTIGNLLNEPPPFTNGGNTQSNNWDDRYADARLRNYLLTVSYKF